MDGNRFLDSLPASDLGDLHASLRRVSLPQGAVLWEAGDCVDIVHFPLDAQVSNAVVYADGSTIETAVVGAEGMTGLLPFLAEAPSAWRATVRLGGDALTVQAERLRTLQDKSRTLRLGLLRLGYYYQVQGAFNVGCIARHPVRARVARWILSAADITGLTEVRLTQEELAALLHVQRTSVVEAFTSLKAARTIRHLRGTITIRDREALERASCDCYAALKPYERFARQGAASPCANTDLAIA